MRILVFFLFISIGSTAKAINTDPVEVRKQQIETILELTRENIYDYRLMDTPEWKVFEAFLTAEETLLMDEQEFVSAFNVARKKLPFTHYSLSSKNRPKASGIFNFSNICQCLSTMI